MDYISNEVSILHEFLYKVVKFFRPKSKYLRFKMPKYNFEFYCRKNKDDFKIMTIHEQDIIDHFIPNERDFVVDVGAHIGLYTIIASKRVGPKGKVIAIEVDPNNFEILKRNIEFNNLTNVIELNYAAYSKEKRMKLYLVGERHEEKAAKSSSGFTKYNTLMSNFVKQDEKFIEVNTNTPGNILSQLIGIRPEQINWIKIDVEGAGFEVLKEAHKTVSEAKDIAILIELHGSTYDYRPKVELVKLYNFKIGFQK